MNKLIAITFFCLPHLSFAFFCPTNFNQIEIGDSLEQVTQSCGKPDKQEEREVKKEGAQEWSYFIPQAVATDSMATTQGTLKTQIAFDSDGKVVNISVNGIGVGATAICGQNIQLGDKRDAVKAACGDPVNKQEFSNAATNTQPAPKIIEFTYNTNPVVKLIFEEGKLKEKK